MYKESLFPYPYMVTNDQLIFGVKHTGQIPIDTFRGFDVEDTMSIPCPQLIFIGEHAVSTNDHFFSLVDMQAKMRTGCTGIVDQG